MKRWMALLLCFLFICTSAAAEVTFWPELDPLAGPMQLELSAEAVSHMPFDDVRVSWLNGLLKHMKLTARYQPLMDEEYLSMALTVDDEEIFAISQCEDAQSSMVQLSLMPDMTYVTPSGTSALALLLDMPEAAEPDLLGVTMDDLSMLKAAEQLMNLIRREWSDSISNKASKQQISGYGNTTRKLTLTVASDDAESFGQWLAEHCDHARLAEIIGRLSFTGKQTLVWLIDNEDRVHKFTYTGNFNAEGTDRRRLSITWNMARTATTTKDSLTVKTPQTNEKNTEYNTFTWKRTLQEKNGALTDKEEWTYTQRLNKQKLAMSGSADMKRTDEDGLAKLTGTVTFKRTQPEAAEEQLDLVLDVLADEADSSVLGYVTVTSQVDKLNRESAVLHVNLTPCEPLAWTLLPFNTDLDRLSEADLVALRSRISEKATLALIRPLVLLPREDTLFLSQDLPDEAWQAIVNAAQGE